MDQTRRRILHRWRQLRYGCRFTNINDGSRSGTAPGWDRVTAAHTLVHAFEEMGEVARLVLQWEGYKDADSPEKLHAELEEELSDVFVFLFKLAYQTGVDVEAALARGQVKADGRYPDLEQAGAELAALPRPAGRRIGPAVERRRTSQE